MVSTPHHRAGRPVFCCRGNVKCADGGWWGSDPGLPALPDPAQQVGVGGLVQEALHLLLHRQALGGQAGAHVVLLRAQRHALHPAEGCVLLEAQLQLLTAHSQSQHRRQSVSFG